MPRNVRSLAILGCLEAPLLKCQNPSAMGKTQSKTHTNSISKSTQLLAFHSIKQDDATNREKPKKFGMFGSTVAEKSEPCSDRVKRYRKHIKTQFRNQRNGQLFTVSDKTMPRNVRSLRNLGCLEAPLLKCQNPAAMGENAIENT